VQRVLARGQHFLCAAADDNQRAAGNRFLDDVASYFDQLLVGWAFRCRHR
jgi:hypothetical protein